MVGVKREGLLKWVREGKFPPPIKVSANVSVWPESVVQAWIKNLMDKQRTGEK